MRGDPYKRSHLVALLAQQAVDLTLLAIGLFAGFHIVVKKRHGYIERGGDLLQPACANAVDAFLVFLHLLEADAERLSKFILRYFLLDATQPDAFAKFNVLRTARPLIFARVTLVACRSLPV